MALKEYEVEVGGLKHTLQLSDEDAKRFDGAKEIKRPVNKAAPQPADKAVSTKNTK